MRRHTIAVLLLLFSFPAGAQSAAIPATVDYAWGFPIRTQATASFYAVELPIEVNRSVTDPDLRDAGVYNSDGKPVPHLIAPVHDESERTIRSSPLPILPLYASGRPDESRITLQRDGDGTQFSLEIEDVKTPAEGERLVAYIVDARQADDNAVALELIWAPRASGFMGSVTVEGSNDLQNWTAAGAAVVADLKEDSASIVQRRVKLRPADYDYLRIRWEGMPEDWGLSQVMGVFMQGAAEPRRKLLRLDSAGVDENDGGRLFEVGAAPMIDQVQIVLPVANTVISARIEYWSDNSEVWVSVGHRTFHHIVRDNNSVMSEPLRISNTRASLFKVVVTQGPADVAMQLEVGWRPDSLLFLAQGQAPYTLVTGNASDAAGQFPLHRTYSDSSLAKLAEDNGGVSDASLGPRYPLGGPERLNITRPTDWRTVMLWFALLLGVAFVGLMASKTIRELKSQS